MPRKEKYDTKSAKIEGNGERRKYGQIVQAVVLTVEIIG